MELTQLVSAPKLTKVILKDVELPKLNEAGEKELDKKGNPVTYKEPEITFYTHDRQPLGVYLELTRALGSDQLASVELLKKLILDKDGKQIIVDDRVPPVNVMVLAMAKVMELLGK